MEPNKYALSPDQYRSALSEATQSQDFTALNDDSRQEYIKNFRAGYLKDNPEADLDTVNSITEGINKSYLRGTGRGRVVPKININFPDQEKGYKDLSRSQKQERLDAFKEKIPAIAKANPVQREDTEYYLTQRLEELQYRQDLPVYILTGSVSLCLLLLLTYGWAKLSIRQSSSLLEKKKTLDSWSLVFFILFAAGSASILVFLGCSAVAIVPCLIGLGGIAFVRKFGSFCETCQKPTWAIPVCASCRESSVVTEAPH